jgi:hypothetical protein
VAQSSEAAEDPIARVERRCDEILERLDALSQQFSELAVRESELRAILRRNLEQEPYLDRLTKMIRKEATRQEVADNVDRAPLHLQPFPYTVIDGLLPDHLYDALVQGLPPVELFKNRPVRKQQLAVPFELAPVYSQRIWTHFADTLIPEVIAPRLIQKFRGPLDEWIRRNWPDINPESITLRGSGGRIMHRGRGYRIRPHRDPKWSFITCILYLARPGDNESWGTQLYAVERDEEAKDAAPYWIDEKRCHLAEDVKFIRNRLLVFLNSAGAHGAHIPEDAEPPDLERYIYQFRVGPPIDVVAMLKSRLPEDRIPLWTGKLLVDY